MKIKDLKYYKPLDITELSGSPWNNAEKVLGLDENDKVIMAEPDGVVTPEDVADAVNQAMEAETARTEDAYAKKDEIPDMEDYYTKEEVDEAISGITVDLSDYYTKDETDQAISAATQDLASTDYVDDAIAAIPEPDLSDYYTKDETDGAISTALVPYATKGWVSSQSYANQNYVMFKVNEAMQIETARTESTYAKPSDIPSLDGYATEQYVDNAVSSATQDMATEQYVNDAIAAIPGVDLSDYALISSVTADINTAIANETARTESTYAKPSQIPSLDGYATEQWVESQGYLTEHQDLSAYAKTTAVTQDIQTAMAAETARTESTYLKEHQSLDNYYTKSEVDADFVSAATAVGQALDAAVDGLASETYVDNAVAGLASEDYVNDAVSAATEGMATQEYVDNAVAGIDFPDDYATTGDVASAVEGLASESYVDDAITSATQGMATQSDLEGLASQEYVDAAVTELAQGIGMLGMVNDVSESNGTVTVQKTTMQEGQLVTGSTSFNIATPGDIQTAIASETARTESTYLKEHQSLDNYYTKSQVDAEITGATEDMATKTWVGQQGYLTQHQDLSAYAKTTAVTEDIASAIAAETARTESTYLKEHQDITGKLDKTDFDTYTGATETVLAGKLDATAYTIDNTIDSASTNPVENRVINAALNGVTSSTQMEISSVDSGIGFRCTIWQNSSSQRINGYLKETNIPGYYAISIKSLVDAATTLANPDKFECDYFTIDNVQYGGEQQNTITTDTLGTKLYVYSGYFGSIRLSKTDVDGTFDYYLIFNAEDKYASVYKTIPIINKITDHKANISDLPTAQDGTDFNQFVYNGSGNKLVVSTVSTNTRQNITNSYRQYEFTYTTGSWGGASSSSGSTRFMPGNECIDGVKSARDSQVISKAEEALNGFTEQITLTLGNRSATEKIKMVLDVYFYETNNPRYLAVPTSEAISGMIQNLTLSGTTYYVQNPISQDNYRPVTGKYQLGTRSGTFSFNKSMVGNTYIIIDTELLTLEISDSLTITRAKSLQETIGNIESLLASI